MRLCEIHAREKLGMSEEWAIFKWKAMPPLGNETLYYEVEGMVAPLKMHGKNKGFRYWKCGDKATLKKCILPVEEHRKWIADWEKKINKCSRCLGEGKEFVSWDITTGYINKTCTKCKGTGKFIHD